MKKNGLGWVIAAGGVAAASFACAEQVVPVWPEGNIPLKTSDAPEKVNPSEDDIIRLTNVNVPTLTVFPAENKGVPTPAVLVCPGGAYSILAWNHEGTEVAEWLNKQDVTAFVLKYRVPNNRDGAFCDVQRAMGLIRSRAEEFNVNPTKVGIMGFSAGGHLAVRVCTNFEKRFYNPVDMADRFPCRPDFALILYPAYLSGPNRSMAEGLPVTIDTPPTFLVQSQDDISYVESSLAYHPALLEVGVPVEMHFFPDGGHGYGLRQRGKTSDVWPSRAEVWLKVQSEDRTSKMRSLMILAYATMDQGKFDEVENVILPRMEKIVGTADDYNILVTRGRLFQAKGQPFFPQAREAFLRAARLRPDYPDVMHHVLQLDRQMQDK
ncbi:MAG: alpha/beta hydrolase fold domain-containing protein [Kiritimatiellaeota bacterium]|nr:alpha/beta hydrolase fold domain-containing protein [Kiritimatiellota bacterium]